MKMARARNLVIGCMTLGLLAACGSDERLRSFRNTSPGPEEFNVSPTKPLEAPTNMASLPVPTPGGANRVDQNPKADAVAALGGSAAALSRTGVPASDNALVNYAGRAGLDPSIRPVLAAEDAEFRRREASWTALNPFNIDRYYRAYKDQAIEPREVADAFRRAGVKTPAYPPEYD